MFAPGAGRPLGITAGFLVLGAVLAALRVLPPSFAFLALYFMALGFWAFFAWFFRDPERPVGEGIVSPADGRVRAITVEGDRTRISVFMNVTDVHVNRMPLDGTFSQIGTAGSGYRPAYQPDADHNVARTYDLDTAYGPVRVVQVTGILARRLVSFVGVGDRRRRGDRFGMIVLGSRVDLVLPNRQLAPVVREGDRVQAGRTTVAQERA
ncbi:MAG: phosphatidylserine decarboxylase [Thermoplasmata archaeon]|nr:phosphatidylserine decarboxylase [Thermoplasmata archaeon]